MEEVDGIVIGAGVVGIAVARALAQSGQQIIVLEAAAAIGTGTSSRNSEVIHAGIYYPEGSLMARLCVSGRKRLLAYCAERGVPHRQCGKLIVATSPDEVALLPGILARARANGVEGLRLLDARAAQDMEPALACSAALFSPATGIVDSHAFMLAMQGDAEAAGALFALRSPFHAARVVPGGFEVEVGGDDAMTLRCKTLVNAAGLHAPALAQRIAGLPTVHLPTPFFAKGNYFTLEGRAPFTRLIYPVPVAGGLGVHLTLDLGGQARFGPDVEWIAGPDGIDYTVDARRGDSFYAAIRRYWPALPDGALQAGYSGVRPKLAGPGAAHGDFVVQGPQVHGVAGLVNLFGIESPGLTSALALAERVEATLG